MKKHALHFLSRRHYFSESQRLRRSRAMHGSHAMQFILASPRGYAVAARFEPQMEFRFGVQDRSSHTMHRFQRNQRGYG